MTGFALNLDLTLYFDDLRKYSSVYVDLSKCKEVGDVEKHIKSVFKLEDNICLTNKKFLIPRSENIQILQQYETLKVQKCDFYDFQIHKNRRTNPTCDQTALNLIQSERTIDLSCRPKQRLKINICQSRCIPGPPSTPFVEANSIQIKPQNLSSNIDEASETHSREKQKHKKKKHESKISDDDDGKTSDNILDMSVKKSKRKNYENCFSTDDFDVDTKEDECLKKLKKRKKHATVSDGDVEMPSFSEYNGEIFTDSFQKPKKKSKKHKTEEHNLVTDLSVDGNRSEDNITHDDNNPVRKKHKKSKKSTEYKEHFRPNDNTNFANNSCCKGDVSVEISVPEIEENKSSLNESNSKQNKDKLKIFENSFNFENKDNQMHSTPTNLNFSNSNNIFFGSEQSVRDNFEKTNESCTNGDNSQIDLIDDPSYSEPLGTNVKRKRVRKHKKRKKAKNYENIKLMSAVGPVLEKLSGPPTPKPEYRVQASISTKHIFFDEESSSGNDEKNLVMAFPIPFKTNTTTEGSSKVEVSSGVPANQTDASEKTTDWKQELLKLATSSTPVVFSRGSAPPPNKTDSPAKPSPEATVTIVRQEIATCNIPTKSSADTSTTEEYRRCNGEVHSVNSLEVREPSTSEIRRKIQDTPMPIPTDVENIILTNYPIIDKVVAEDLILFKMLKLNEDKQPGLSKTILARVNNVASFPDKITLQIMEGCEECNPSQPVAESGDGFLVEVRWVDILEPRLFYP